MGLDPPYRSTVSKFASSQTWPGFALKVFTLKR
jgi:hypothetical protein